jgi:hypothetical protein
LCAHLVRESGGAKLDVREAAVAGLLHDLGMLHIAPGLLDSEERLSGDELRPVYVHPLTSSMLVDRFPEYSKDIVRAIVEHHERLDGSGYPAASPASAQPARPRPRPRRGRHRDVRRHAPVCPSTASRSCCGSIRAATTRRTSPPSIASSPSRPRRVMPRASLPSP